MRHTSSKTARLQRTHREARRDFLASFPACWFCGEPSSEVHEIASGLARLLALGKREAWCAACTRCNCHELTNRKVWPVERQLAVKLVNDPAWFNLVMVCELRGRAPTAIVLADVARWLTWI